MTPALSQAAIMASASASVIASGFSQSTGLPAAAAASTTGICLSFGVMTKTASTSGSVTSVSCVAWKFGMPCIAQKARPLAGSRVAPAWITACSARREAPITVVASEPRPTRPQRNVRTAIPHPFPIAREG